MDESKSKIFSGLIWKFGERITAQLISLLVSIILARLLSPDEYGAVAIVMIFITLANVFVSSGFGNALIQKKDADNLDFSSVFYINIAIGIALYIVIFCIAPFVANFYDMPILSPTLRVLGIRIVIASINSVQQAYVSRNMLFKRFFWSTLFGTLVSGIVGVVMAYHGFGVWALVAQYLTNTCTDTVVLWFTVRWRPCLQCSFSRAKELFSYGWKLLLSGLLDTGYKQLRSLIIGRKYSSSDLAYYNQGDKYPALLVTNINASISSVIFPAMAQCQDDRTKVKSMTRRAIQISSFVLWPCMLGVAAIAKPLVVFLLTDKWLPCVPYIRIFCFTYGLWPIHTANLQAINAVGRSDLFLKLEITKKIVGMVAILVSMNYGPLVMAYSLVVTDLIATVINAFPNKELLKYGYFEQIKDMMPSFVIALVMVLIIYPVQNLGLSNITTIIIQVLLGGSVYIALAILTKQKSLTYLLEIVKRHDKK